MLYNGVGKYNIAKKLIERAIELRPTQPEFMVNYALVLKNSGNIEDAEKVLFNVVKNNVEFSKKLGIFD
jgi:predicted Zn-dependent protease